MYKIKKRYLDKSPCLVTSLPNGERVNLAGEDITVTVEPTKNNPNTKKIIRGLKQSELDSLFGNEPTQYLLDYYDWVDDKGEITPARDKFQSNKSK